MKRLAQQLYLLEKACFSVRSKQPSDAFLWVQAARDSGVTATLNDEFARKLGQMYRRWGEKRRMQVHVLEETGDDGKTPYHLLLALSGFGALAILQPEDGLHILEIPELEERSFKRCRAQIRVVPQPDEPAGAGLEPLRRQAVHTFDSHGPGSITVVRRYREYPSPLVRDSVRGWRTGRLDRVLGGDFDLIVEKERE
jgi:ATP-dependent Clp protease ATP-binding subunit ClpC